MKRFFTIAAAAALTATTAVADDGILPSGEDGFEGYGAIEGWNVIIDKSRNTCLIETQDAGGNVVQMGLTADRSAGYVGIFTQADIKARKNKKKGIVIVLRDNVYAGEVTQMRGNITKGFQGGYVLSDDPAFVEDLAKAEAMVVFPEEKFTFVVDLAGSYKAIEAARDCTKEQQG